MGSAQNIPWLRALEKEKQIDIIVHNGQIKKIICELYNNGICKSTKNNGNQCILDYQ